MVRQTGPATKNGTMTTGYRQQSWQKEFSKGKSYPQESQLYTHSDGLHTEHCHLRWAHTAESIWISHLKKQEPLSPELFFPKNILAGDLAPPLATPYSDGLAEKYRSQADGFCQAGNSASSRKGQASSSISTKERGKNCAAVEKEIPLPAVADWKISLTILCNSTGRNKLLWS